MEQEEQNVKQETSHNLKKQEKKSTFHQKDNIHVSGSIDNSATASHTSTNSIKSLFDLKLGKNGLFKLGLQMKYASVVHILIAQEGLGSNPDTITHVFSKIAAGLSALSKSLKVDMQIISVFEYQLSFADTNSKKKPNIAAIECALKVSKVLSGVLSSDHDLDDQRKLFSIGISSGKAHVGNLGTKNLRFYSIIGSCCQYAQTLARIGTNYHSSIVVDSSTLNEEAKPLFVFRPIDRLNLNTSSTTSDPKDITTVYEVFKENSYENDEWLYELDQQKKNLKYKEFEKAFQIFDLVHDNSIGQEEIPQILIDSKKILENHLIHNPEDRLITKNLLHAFEYFLKENDSACGVCQMVNNYHSIIHQSLRSFSTSGIKYANAADFEIRNVIL